MSRLVEVVEGRGEVPLITVSNHASCLDDPVLFGLLPWRCGLGPRMKMRWSVAAQEILFTSKLKTWFFAKGQTIPIVRGDGIFQKGVEHALECLAQNRWVHVFSEGRVNQLRTLLPFRWGVGRLVMESPVPPIVVPFWHSGMHRVLPEPECPQDPPMSEGETPHPQKDTPAPGVGPVQPLPVDLEAPIELQSSNPLPPLPPKLQPPLTRSIRLFQMITVNYGAPIHTAPLLELWKSQGLDEVAVRVKITEHIRNAVLETQKEALAYMEAQTLLQAEEKLRKMTKKKKK